MKLRLSIPLLESILEIRWQLPSFSKEYEEIKRYLKKELKKDRLSDDDFEDYKEQFKHSNMRELSDYVWMQLKNTDSWKVDSFKKVVELSAHYKKDYKKILKAIVEEKYIDAPIVIRKGGEYELVSGNTRLMICKILNIRPKVLFLKWDD